MAVSYLTHAAQATRPAANLTMPSGLPRPHRARGKQPKLSDKQQRELRRMHDTGEYSISDLAELFSVSRPTIYRTLAR
jgi:DNA invertase Pin-like site-specific DNA recombinase